MSEGKKQVIHVKDLVIKADNVRIEPSRESRPQPRPPRHRRDPFLGRRPMNEEDREEHEDKEFESSSEEQHHEDDRREEERDDHDDRKRGPFSLF
ncbi:MULTISPECIES: hypothetical protein [Virgibacillus]|uniref:Uncharacterized protein n=2 Tax=Virgibacillus TaxID=84406 RepID=A0A024QEJ9_9BACI|nr:MULTISPECIES: hypothetical protein [Virgibacillus]EQB35212.1 hypothetical protein M948_19115 [Virgibacillus sp. CM-4]MYL42733.1 hypothetical protein [Virgibacillus massiliensis]GGJ68986.1 hypothetical protein GCM10007111_33340 [Virgibacillus kapii]CDQ40625.1 hypothetical protein BN990_02951 [Virgibacillus massiliensis]